MPSDKACAAPNHACRYDPRAELPLRTQPASSSPVARVRAGAGDREIGGPEGSGIMLRNSRCGCLLWELMSFGSWLAMHVPIAEGFAILLSTPKGRKLRLKTHTASSTAPRAWSSHASHGQVMSELQRGCQQTGVCAESLACRQKHHQSQCPVAAAPLLE